MIKETEQLKSRLMDADEDLERIKEEEIKVYNLLLELPTRRGINYIVDPEKR